MFDLQSSEFRPLMAKLESYDILSKEEEHELAVQYYNTKCEHAAKKLCEHNLMFVIKVANEYHVKYRMPLMELFQEGVIGLMTAIKRYNPYKEIKLISYAVHWIRAKIQQYIIRNKYIVMDSSRQHLDSLFLKNKIYNRSYKEIYLNEDCGNNEYDNSNNKTFEELLELEQPEEHTDIFLRDRLLNFIDSLPPREQYIITNRLLNEDTTLQELADELNISKQRVHEIEAKLKNKFREYITTEDLC